MKRCILGGVGTAIAFLASRSAFAAGEIPPCPIPNPAPYDNCKTDKRANWCIQKTTPDAAPPVRYELSPAGQQNKFYQVIYIEGDIQQNRRAVPDLGYEQTAPDGKVTAGAVPKPDLGPYGSPGNPVFLQGAHVVLLLEHGCGSRAQGSVTPLTRRQFLAFSARGKQAAPK